MRRPTSPRALASAADLTAAVSRRFKALTQARLEGWIASELSALDLLVIRIDVLHMDDKLLMPGVVGVDADGRKHPLGVVEAAKGSGASRRTGSRPSSRPPLLRHREAKPAPGADQTAQAARP